MANKNEDFKFEEFASGAIASIDSLRSFMKEGGNLPTESRINAFYRALGLPCVIPENKEKSEGRDTNTNIPDTSLNNGNTFSGENNSLKYDTYKEALNKRQVGFSTEISEEEAEAFIKRNKTLPNYSIEEKNGRARGCLFPMVVDGSIFIHPAGRRVGGAFMNDSDLRHKKDIYKRPLIETILYIKLQGSGAFNSEKQSDVSVAFQSEDLKTLYKSVESNFDKTISSIADYFINVITDLNNTNKQTSDYIVPNRTYNTDQSHAIKSSEKSKGELDRQEDRIEYTQTLNKTILSLFEFNDVAGLSFARNLTDASLSGSLLSVLSPEPEDGGVAKTVSDISDKREKVKQHLKTDFRGLDFLLGTFSGISGLDILVIMYALFKMEDAEVIALLNDEAKARLKAKTGVSSGNMDVASAITKLQEKVKTIYDNVKSAIGKKKHKDMKKNTKATGGN